MDDNYERILREAKADYDRTNMYSDFLQLKLGQTKFSIDRLNEMLKLFTSEEKYDWCAIIKKTIDESLDN